jgi:peptidyl-prolyl isomerase E (cyclophilin E)
MSAEESSNLYVYGLPASVTGDVVRAAFIPFGDLLDVHVPVDPKVGAPRGYAFVLFESADDAKSAIDNMDNNVIHGQRIRVRKAQKRTGVGAGTAVWHSADLTEE